MQMLQDNWNNILNFFGTLFPFSFIFGVWQYLKNKTVEKYINEKELEIKKVELDRENKKFQKIIGDSGSQLLSVSGIDIINKIEEEHDFKIKKLSIEIQCLEKILNK